MDEPALNFQVIVFRAHYEATWDGKQEYKHSDPQDKRFFFKTAEELGEWLKQQTYADHEVYYVSVFADTEEEHRNRGSKKDTDEREWPQGMPGAPLSVSHPTAIEQLEAAGRLEPVVHMPSLLERVKKLEEYDWLIHQINENMGRLTHSQEMLKKRMDKLDPQEASDGDDTA